MPVQRLAPEGLFKPSAYTQVVVATGRRMVFVSGQVSMDAQGKLVAPGDLRDRRGRSTRTSEARWRAHAQNRPTSSN